MGIHGMRNLFESNEPDVPREDLDKYSDNLHALLPEPPEGHTYELTKLSDGRNAVVTVKALKGEIETCNCGPYQCCDVCQKYQGSEDLDSDESRTLRHRD